jgi:hypothetical protein
MQTEFTDAVFYIACIMYDYFIVLTSFAHELHLRDIMSYRVSYSVLFMIELHVISYQDLK